MDFGVNVPFVAFGVVVNLMFGRGFLTESRCGVLAKSAFVLKCEEGRTYIVCCCR